MLHNVFSEQAHHVAQRQSCQRGTRCLPGHQGWLVLPKGLPASHRATGGGQGGDAPWGHRAAPTHALGVAVGLFLCWGGGGGSRWGFLQLCLVSGHPRAGQVRDAQAYLGLGREGKRMCYPKILGRERGWGVGRNAGCCLRSWQRHPGWQQPRAAGQTPTRLVHGSGVPGHLEFTPEHAASPGRVPAAVSQPSFTAGQVLHGPHRRRIACPTCLPP